MLGNYLFGVKLKILILTNINIQAMVLNLMHAEVCHCQGIFIIKKKDIIILGRGPTQE